MISINPPPGLSNSDWTEIPSDLYRWFLFAYALIAAGRMAAEAYRQIAIHGTAWYDVPTAAFQVLEIGFIQHILLSLAAAEAANMVLGALMKRKARKEGRIQGLDEGLTKGHAQGLDEGLTKGHTQGRAEGLDEGLTKGRAEGVAEGRTGANRQWRAWLERKTAAETAGQPFHEPPPDSA